MKKGIVMERHRKYTILMTKDGSFVKGRVLSNQSEIGEEVVFRPIGNRQVMLRKQRGIPWKVSLLAAAVLLVILPIYFLSNGEKAFAYVTVDINPSIEMQVDDQFEVQTIEAINDDGEEVIRSLSEYEHDSIEEVIRQIILESEDHGFASEKNMVVGISYSGEDISYSIPNHLQDYLSTLQEWRVATLVIPEEIRELAQEEKTSMNEMMATQMNDNEELIDEEALDSNDKAIINSFFNEIEEANPDSSQQETEKKEDTEAINEEENSDNEKKQNIANSAQKKEIVNTVEEDQDENIPDKEHKVREEKKERPPEKHWENKQVPSEKNNKKKQHEDKNHKSKLDEEIHDKYKEEHKNFKEHKSKSYKEHKNYKKQKYKYYKKHKNGKDKRNGHHHRTNSKHKHNELPKKEKNHNKEFK